MFLFLLAHPPEKNPNIQQLLHIIIFKAMYLSTNTLFIVNIKP